MKIEQLEYFLAVANCLNFTTAAKQLYVGQSTISRQIAALEENLGVTLLIRNSRSVKLTNAGHALQQEGVKLLDYIEQMKTRVRQAGSGVTGQLCIVSIPAYIPKLSKIQEKVMKVYPCLQLAFNHASYDKISHLLDVGAADVGVTFSFWDHMEPVYEHLPFCEEHFCVLCGRKHWAAVKEAEGIYMDELKDQVVYFGREGIHLVRYPLDFQDSVVTSSAYNSNAFPTLEDMLMQLSVTPGVVVLPSVVANTLKNNLACIPVLDKDLKHQLHMIWRKDNESPALSRFLEVVRNCIDE